jgi:catechol 2,3-dioxygenase-like lactoylglutathione lyase family enzyme
MARLDHIVISVRDWKRSRDWYTQHLGFEVEFENADAKVAGLKDEADLTLIVAETDGPVAAHDGLMFSIQVPDVEAKHRELAACGVAFVHEPKKVGWGYGAELRDPDGYRLGLWDEASMKEKGFG